MQFNNKIMALALLFAPLALTAPTDNTPPVALAESAVDLTLGSSCTPSAYQCKCDNIVRHCWIEVCNASRVWVLSARCRERINPNPNPTCKNGPNKTAYCV
ncbi:hypothetical protein EMCG_04892 [[Emmonsia] crescens]|uniref:Extracellular membrane protein CFEM domain-containing protein n=1 Tax=[Emmonsia] crescens TaxID=73230 RepID=A0A0G2HQJ0_9EURO|nr:hypothetical protein EMCG_04892 [Emmonsia crescens UAMH 3008]